GGLRRHPDRGVRGPRPQGPLRQGPGGGDPGLHRHRRPLRGARTPRPAPDTHRRRRRRPGGPRARPAPVVGRTGAVQPLLGPRQRARLARQYGCLTVGSITCGVVLLVLMALVAFGAVDNDPATAADGPGGPVGDAVKIAVGVAGAVTFLVLMPLMAW